MGKINVIDKIIIEKHKKIEILEIKEFLHDFPSNALLTNRIHSLLNRADARESADIIYRM